MFRGLDLTRSYSWPVDEPRRFRLCFRSPPGVPRAFVTPPRLLTVWDFESQSRSKIAGRWRHTLHLKTRKNKQETTKQKTSDYNFSADCLISSIPLSWRQTSTQILTNFARLRDVDDLHNYFQNCVILLRFIWTRWNNQQYASKS